MNKNEASEHKNQSTKQQQSSTDSEKMAFSNFFQESLWKRIVCFDQQKNQSQISPDYATQLADKIKTPSELYQLASSTTTTKIDGQVILNNNKKEFMTTEEKQFDLYFSRVLSAVLVDVGNEKQTR